MMQKGSLDLMIDVREGWERSIERIDPSIHIPLGNFENPTQVILPEKKSVRIQKFYFIAKQA